MKKVLTILAIFCTSLMFSACDRSEVSIGILQNPVFKNSTTLEAFDLKETNTEEQSSMHFTLKEGAVISTGPHYSAGELNEENLEETEFLVSAYYKKPLFNSLFKRGSIEVDSVQIDGMKTKESITLPNGVVLYKWEYGYWNHGYALEDGTDILRIEDDFGPANVTANGLGIESLSETAKGNIVRYFEELALPYDLMTETERAYSYYQEQDDSSLKYWNAISISQSTVPIAESASVFYIKRDSLLPIYNSKQDETHQGLQEGYAFDKETGDLLEVWDLFTVKKDEAMNILIEDLLAKDLSENDKEILRKQIDSTSFVFYPDHLEISYLKQNEEREVMTYILTLSYDSALSEIMQDWAVPQAQSE